MMAGDFIEPRGFGLYRCVRTLYLMKNGGIAAYLISI